MARFRRLLLLLLIFLVICLPAAVVAAESVNFMGESLEYDRIYSYDVNEDGSEELTFYILGDALVLSVWDTETNGVPDRWFAYGNDDVLILEGVDTTGRGEPDLFYAIDSEGEATPVTVSSSTILPLFMFIGIGIIVLVLILVFRRKKMADVISLILVFALFTCNAAPALGESIIDDNCEINEAVFASDWLKYSDIDANTELATRFWEAQQVQLLSDELKFHYEALYITELEMGLEVAKRKELKTIKNLLVNNIKANLLKSFMRLTYVTYDVIRSGYGLKGSVNTILDRTASGVQILTSYIKMQKTLTIPSKTEEQTKSILDRGANLANSSLLEYFDTLGDPKKMATNLINDLQKEAFDIAKAEDQWADPKLSDTDFQILRNQYQRNRDLDVAIQESYLISSQLRESRDEHKAAIETLEAEYQGWIAEEKARIRDFLISSCERAENDEEDIRDEIDEDGEFVTFQYPESLVNNQVFNQLLEGLDAEYNLESTTQADGSVIYIISQEQREQILKNLDDNFESYTDFSSWSGISSEKASQIISRVYYEDGYRGVTMELNPDDEKEVVLVGSMLGAITFFTSILYQSLNGIEYHEIKFSVYKAYPGGGVFDSRTYKASEEFPY